MRPQLLYLRTEPPGGVFLRRFLLQHHLRRFQPLNRLKRLPQRPAQLLRFVYRAPVCFFQVVPPLPRLRKTLFKPLSLARLFGQLRLRLVPQLNHHVIVFFSPGQRVFRFGKRALRRFYLFFRLRYLVVGVRNNRFQLARARPSRPFSNSLRLYPVRQLRLFGKRKLRMVFHDLGDVGLVVDFLALILLELRVVHQLGK